MRREFAGVVTPRLPTGYFPQGAGDAVSLPTSPAGHGEPFAGARRAVRLEDPPEAAAVGPTLTGYHAPTCHYAQQGLIGPTSAVVSWSCPPSRSRMHPELWPDLVAGFSHVRLAVAKCRRKSARDGATNMRLCQGVGCRLATRSHRWRQTWDVQARAWVPSGATAFTLPYALSLRALAHLCRIFQCVK